MARHIVPVELNSYLCKNSRILMELYDELGNDPKKEAYKKQMEDLMEAIDAVLWNPEVGSWFDYDLSNTKQRVYFYASTMAPLWAECYPLVLSSLACCCIL